MKETLTFIGIITFAIALWFITVSLWFLRGQNDKKLIDSNNQTISSLQDTIKSKDDLIAKNKAVIDGGNATLKSLQDTVQAKDDTIAKDKALLEAKDESIKSLQGDMQTKDDTIAKDKINLDARDEVIRTLKENIAAQQAQGTQAPQENVANGNGDVVLEKIYPGDNGFDAQDMGTGLQVFGPIKNPNNVPMPDKVPNHTPWKFGDGNSGIAANGSGYYVSNATNGDSDGKTSTSGQAGSLEYKGSSISQSIALPAGTFTVTFDFESRRDYAPNEIEVSIDGTALFQGSPTDTNNFKKVTTRSITLTSKGKHELMFRALGSAGDVSPYPCTFIDNVYLNRIDPTKSATNKGGPFQDIHLDPIQNPPPPAPGASADDSSVLEKIYPKDNGFDAQDLGAGAMAYQYFGKEITNPQDAPEPDRTPNHTPWTFSGNAGIAANESWYITGATNGDSDGKTSTSGQVGFLQFKDSSISQSVTLPAGTYTVTFDYKGRAAYEPANQITVSIDGTTLFQGAPTDVNNFKKVRTNCITLTTSGKHDLKFCGLGGDGDVTGDHTTFIDNICINRIDPKKAPPNKEIVEPAATKAPEPSKKHLDSDGLDITEQNKADHSPAPASGLAGSRILQ